MEDKSTSAHSQRSLTRKTPAKDCADDVQPQLRAVPPTEAEKQALFEAAKARVMTNHRANIDWLAQR